MRVLCMQFQPRRAAGLDVLFVTILMARIAVTTGCGFAFHRDSDRGPYINYVFHSPAPGRVWRALHQQALGHRRIGTRLRRATIVTCQRSRGWKNYLLLHHFDNALPLDTLAGA